MVSSAEGGHEAWLKGPGRWPWRRHCGTWGLHWSRPCREAGAGQTPGCTEERAGEVVDRQTDRGLSCGRGSGEPARRPGPDALPCLQCPGGTFTPSMKSTKDYPDEVINFMRSHPLMYQPVYPLQRRPLVVRTGAPYRLTTVAVDQVDAADGRYEVLFLGTGTHCCSQPLLRWARGWRGLLHGAGTYALGVATGWARSALPPSSCGAFSLWPG